MNDYKKRKKEISTNEFLNLDEKEYYLEILNTLQAQEAAMTKEDIMAHAARIRPIMRGNNSDNISSCPCSPDAKMFWIKSTLIHNDSCAFNHTAIKPAVGLKEIGRILSFHRYGSYYGCLTPSADEAIIQCPKEILDKVCAFEFYTPTLDFHKVYDVNLDRHVLTTIYYEGELPEDVKSQPVKW